MESINTSKDQMWKDVRSLSFLTMSKVERVLDNVISRGLLKEKIIDTLYESNIKNEEVRLIYPEIQRELDSHFEISDEHGNLHESWKYEDFYKNIKNSAFNFIENYVEKWAMYNNLDWDAKSMNRSDLFG